MTHAPTPSTPRLHAWAWAGGVSVGMAAAAAAATFRYTQQLSPTLRLPRHAAPRTHCRRSGRDAEAAPGACARQLPHSASARRARSPAPPPPPGLVPCVARLARAAASSALRRAFRATRTRRTACARCARGCCGVARTRALRPAQARRRRGGISAVEVVGGTCARRAPGTLPVAAVRHSAPHVRVAGRVAAAAHCAHAPRCGTSPPPPPGRRRWQAGLQQR
jgi:hypothetical protein